MPGMRLFAAVAFLAASNASAAPPNLSAADRWFCYYGKTVSSSTWNSSELAMLDPDAFGNPPPSGALALGYVSVGEADERRSFWPEARGKDYLIEPNPDWPKAHRVDLRDARWRSLLLDSVIARVLEKGYSGVMLDTIDTAEYLESSAPARFAGSAAAAVSLVKEMRARYPDAAIVVNNGLPLLEQLGSAVDGVLVEDLYTRCLPKEKSCPPTPSSVRDEKEKILRSFRRRTGRPVFVLIYARLEESKTRRIRRAAARAKRLGFLPYVVEPALLRLGMISP